MDTVWGVVTNHRLVVVVTRVELTTQHHRSKPILVLEVRSEGQRVLGVDAQRVEIALIGTVVAAVNPSLVGKRRRNDERSRPILRRA